MWRSLAAARTCSLPTPPSHATCRRASVSASLRITLFAPAVVRLNSQAAAARQRPTVSAASNTEPHTSISSDHVPRRHPTPPQTAARSASHAAQQSAPTSQQAAARPIPPPMSTPVPDPTPATMSPVWSWGVGYLAGLGRRSYSPAPLPLPIHALRNLPVTSVSSSWSRSMALTRDGAIYTWGWRPIMRSALFVAKLARRFPLLVTTLQMFPFLGRMTLCAAENLEPKRMDGWGDPAADQLKKSDADTEVMDDENGEVEEVEPLRAVSGACGADFSAVVANDGQVHTWGTGYYGQLGHSKHLSETWSKVPRQICHYQNHHPNESYGRNTENAPKSEEGLPKSYPHAPMAAVAAGFSHLLILTRTGQVYSCGKSDTGALGITHIQRESTRVFLPHLIPVTDPFAASEQGSGDAGLTGLIENQDNRKKKPSDSRWLAAQSAPEIAQHYIGPMISIAAGMKHSLFANAAGEVYGCGTNGLNELGNGTYHPVFGLIKIKIPLVGGARNSDATGKTQKLSPIARRKLGQSSTAAAAALHADDNSSFFGGRGSSGPIERIIKVAAGNHHSLALSNLGHVYAWGLNQQGQCGRPCQATLDEKERKKRGMMRWGRGKAEQNAASMAVAQASQATGANLSKDAESDHDASQSEADLDPNSPQNIARRKAVESMCLNPTRIILDPVTLGLPPSKPLGTVIDIIAGFHDSALITDHGNCIMFGGALSAAGHHGPYVFSLDRPSPDADDLPNLVRNARGSAVNVVLQNAARTRIKGMAFGLGHALALVA